MVSSTGEMSEGQRGPLRDDQAKNAPDKSFAGVSVSDTSPAVMRIRVMTIDDFSTLGRCALSLR